jgi:two-component system sensor histidine kinase/response regulator
MTRKDIGMNQEAHVASVLVVEDTIENLRLLSDLLGEQGYDVRAVTNGRQALQAVEHDPPDLILLDINLPELNGYEVCRRLRTKERSKDVPVIFITALTDTADKVRAFDAGGVDYVTKPFQVEEVLARVKTHVALRRAQAELADNYIRLRALEHLRDDLVHMVIHDLRSPLTALLMDLRFLKGSATALSEDNREAALQSALEAADAINRMANDVLDVSRLEACKMPVERAVWDLTQMARDVCSVLGTIDLERPIDIESAAAVEVTCDGALVRRVMENLVSNGIRYSPAGSPMRISIAIGDGSGVSPCTTRGTACLRKPERRSSRSSGQSRLDTNRPTTPSGWVSLSASSRSRPRAGQSVWIPVCPPAARSGSSCPRDGARRLRWATPAPAERGMLCQLVPIHCGGLRHIVGSSLHTPLQRRHSHQTPCMTPHRSGIEGVRRSISGHVSLTVRLSPEDDHTIATISSRPSSNRRIRVLCTDRACKADPQLQARLTRRTDL